MATQRALKTIATRGQVFLQRLKAGEAKKTQAFLREVDGYLRARVGGTEFTRARINAQLAETQAALSAMSHAESARLLADLRPLAEQVADLEVRILDIATSTETTVAAPQQVYAAVTARPLSVRGQWGGKLLEPLVRGWNDGVADRVVDTIRQGFFEGQTNAQILRAIRGTGALRNEDGLLAQMARGEAALVQTAVQHVASIARESVWSANADIITGVEWLSTLDEKTTEICASLDGEVFPIDEGPRPPIHVNCRSATVPRLHDDFAALDRGGTRASIGGQVDSDLTYYEWLKTQPQEFQAEAIGPVRAKLLRDGGLSAKEFAALSLNKNFEPLTLDEMRALEPLMFKNAGF